MALRALSGVVFTRGLRAGAATIRFHPHRAEASEGAAVADLAENGPEGPFRDPPCTHVAPRQITVQPQGGAIASTRSLLIDDEVDAGRLVIRWDSEGPAFVSEISYLVIGEVGSGEAETSGGRREGDRAPARESRTDATP